VPCCLRHDLTLFIWLPCSLQLPIHTDRCVLQFWFHLISLYNNRVLKNYQNGGTVQCCNTVNGGTAVIQLMSLTRINLCVGVLMRFLILMLVNVCIMEIILLDVHMRACSECTQS
jgi:hypothetical protein